jgi:hypothetical protein
MDTCKICGRKCRNKGFTTIGGQKACSIHCAINILPQENDKCAQCGSPVWINDLYKINGLMCCSQTCKEEVEERTNLRSKKKIVKKKSKSDFLEPYQKNDYNNQNDYDFNENKGQKSNNNFINTSSGKKNNITNINIGPSNYALGPRDYNTTDYDVGPGSKGGNLYHGDSNFQNNYNFNDDYDEEDEAYGDYDDANYLREYGQHNYVQKNDGKSGDVLKELGIKLNEGKDKPKNEVREIVHQGEDINCDYCGFSIKAGTNAFVDNFGKVFDTNECFSNHFQGIPKPNFG